ncbi:MAG TPA: hypothetical protein VHO03_08065 [Ignavibacteriales bacterium]|nr:hypothetical protein [Ignavibacteriales bacterium]
MKAEIVSNIIAGLALSGTIINSIFQFKDYKKKNPAIVSCLVKVGVGEIYLSLGIVPNNENGLAVTEVKVKKKYLNLFYGTYKKIKWDYVALMYKDEIYIIKENGFINIYPPEDLIEDKLKIKVKTTIGTCKCKYSFKNNADADLGKLVEEKCQQ